jgi:hypothetical protein
MVSSIEAHIVSHYRADRAAQLGLVLNAMLDWKHCLVRAIITSNVDRYETSGLLQPYKERFAEKGHSLTLNVAADLSNPRMLTWEHKKFIRPWLEHASPGEDYFLYIEDDIVITNANLVYFIRAKNQLKHHRLIPGFVRYETKDDEIRLVDIVRPEYWQRDRSFSIDGALYHANGNPYWAGFIMDRRLVEEYVASRSFSPTESAFMADNLQERSALGLSYESPPRGLRTRVVVPIVNGAPDPDCLVWHCSNSYTAENHPLVAQLTIAQAYRTESLPRYLMRKARGALRLR